MRFAHRKVSPTKSSTHNNTRPEIEQNQHFNPRIEADRMFVHYNNAIYMGGMSSFKRNGKGIFLMDDFTSAITHYSHDTPIANNVYFRNNSIISVLHLKNNIMQFAIRKDNLLIKIPFCERYESPNGNGVIVDYKNMAVYHVLYQNGTITKKIIETNKQLIKKALGQDLQELFDFRHIKAFHFDLCNDGGEMKLLRENRRITIGFINDRHNLQGIAFKLKINQDYDDFKVPLNFHSIERGFYHKSRLEVYGQRYFSNGNLYIGEFDNNLFEGKGLLLYPNQQKWVFGLFQGQKLKKILQVNVDQISQNKYISPKHLLKEVHEQYKKNWISTDIQLANWQLLDNLCIEMVEWEVTDVAIEQKKKIKEEKMRLKRIQDHFSQEDPSNFINKVMIEQVNKSKVNLEKIVLNEYDSLRPKVMEIEPKIQEHSHFWSKQDSREENLKMTRKSKQQNLQKTVKKTLRQLSPSKFSTKHSKGYLSPYCSNKFT